MPSPVYIMSDKYESGIDSLAELEGSSPMEKSSLTDMLRARFHTDAHFVAYHVPGVESLPRLNKPVLRQLREYNMDALLGYIVLDYDNPDHAAWTRETLAGFFSSFEKKADKLLSQWRAVYTTRHGARFIYELEEPIPVDLAEPKISGMVVRGATCGIQFDKLKDWTRLFRVPDAYRAKEQQGDQWWYLTAQQDCTINANDIISVGGVAEAHSVVPLDVDMPTPEEAKELLWEPQGPKGRRARTKFYKQAKSALTGRECYACCFEEAPIARDGERNSTIIRFTGQAVSLLHGYPEATAEKVFALFVPAVEQLDGMDGRRTWLDTLWHGVKLAWERESGRVQDKRHDEEKKQGRVLEGKERLMEGVREWHPGLPLPEDQAWAWISRRMILAAPSKYYILRPDGYYHCTPMTKDMIPAEIRARGMAEMIDGFEYTIYDKDGNAVGTKTETTNKLLERHAIQVQSVRGRANLPGGVLHTDPTGKTYLELGLYSLRDDIEPEYSQDVHEWMLACFGDKTELVEEWVGHALDFDSPIAALSIVGPPSMGKGMFVRGLAECINTRAVADGQEMVDQYQSKITESPFVNVNEGFPIQSYGRSAADNFRRWTSGDPITVNGKFLPTLDIQSPLRLIITANNTEVVRTISLGKTLSIEDRDAIGMRLVHVTAEHDAGDWLRLRGGLSFTARMGGRRRW